MSTLLVDQYTSDSSEHSERNVRFIVTTVDQAARCNGCSAVTEERRYLDRQIRIEQAAVRRFADEALYATGRLWTTECQPSQREVPGVYPLALPIEQ